MPNIRGIQILKIIETVKKYKDIKLEDLVTYLSTNEPYIKPVSSLKIIDQMTKGIEPKLKIVGDKVYTM